MYNSSKQTILVAAHLIRIMNEKRCEYSGQHIKFVHRFTPEANFAFIDINRSNFVQIISDVIDHAILEPCDVEHSTIKVVLSCYRDVLTIAVEKSSDGGGGFSDAIAVDSEALALNFDDIGSHYKADLEKIRFAVRENLGDLEMQSSKYGTRVVLRFPMTVTPHWSTNIVELCENDIIVILDDDPVIHGSWDSKLMTFMKTEAAQFVQIKHFYNAVDCIKFMNSIAQKQRDKILLLSSYSLVGQRMNGVEIIIKSKVKRSILVTNYYDNRHLHAEVAKTGLKVLPKSMIFAVNITMNTSTQNWGNAY